MPPIRNYPSWNQRYPKDEAQIEPFRKFFFICEGRNTERWYFEKLIDLRKELKISPTIEIAYWEKTGMHENLSNPPQLIDFAKEEKEKLLMKGTGFDVERDKIIVVFDADIYETQCDNYDDVIAKADKDMLLAVTNPSFELFLLLHFSNSVEELILPNQAAIIANDWVEMSGKKKRYIDSLFRNKSGMNPKRNSQIGNLVRDVKIAIAQEKKLNNDIHSCKGTVTSNIGTILEQFFDE